MASPTGTMLRRGFVKHCPVCGSGHLFRRWVHMRSTCSTCGLRFKREDGHWLGSWFLNVCVTQTVVILILIIGMAITFPTTPVGLVAALALAAAIVVPFVFFPFSRTIWAAIDLAMRPLEFDDGVAPGFELEAEVAAVRGEGRSAR